VLVVRVQAGHDEQWEKVVEDRRVETDAAEVEPDERERRAVFSSQLSDLGRQDLGS